jgi:hypothetical protein
MLETISMFPFPGNNMLSVMGFSQMWRFSVVYKDLKTGVTRTELRDDIVSSEERVRARFKVWKQSLLTFP